MAALSKGMRGGVESIYKSILQVLHLGFEAETGNVEYITPKRYTGIADTQGSPPIAP